MVAVVITARIEHVNVPKGDQAIVFVVNFQTHEV
jgi:hypothetical protein